MEIAPAIHLVEHLRGSNVYLLEDDRLALIDTGMPGNSEAILSFIRSLGRDPAELAHIVITHGHMDHAGSATELRRMTGAKVVAHTGETARKRDGTSVLNVDYSEAKPWVRGLSHLVRFTPCVVDVPAKDGDTLPYLNGLQVVHTPGHTRGSMCPLLVERGVLFVGDTIINNKDRLSRPLPLGSDTRESEESLARVAQLDFETCCFGHGPTITAGARDLVADFVRSHPSSPLWFRMLRRRHDLARFSARLWKR